MEAVTARSRKPRSANPELGEDQKPSEELGPVVATVVEVVAEAPAPIVARHVFPDLVPEWVPKLQMFASGAALLFAAVAIVVERHEQRYHRYTPTVTTLDDQPNPS